MASKDQDDSFFSPRGSRSDAVQIMALLDASLLVLLDWDHGKEVVLFSFFLRVVQKRGLKEFACVATGCQSWAFCGTDLLSGASAGARAASLRR